MTALKLKPFQAGDGAALLQIHTTAIHNIDETIYDAATKASWAFGLHAQMYQDRVKNGQTITVAMAQNDETLPPQQIGFCSIIGDLLQSLYVLPSAQKQGVGGLLLTHAMAQLFENNATIRVEASLSAKPFYEKYGWCLQHYFDKTTRGGLPLRLAMMSATK